MSSRKKKIRAQFRSAVFLRDNYTCKVCGKQWSAEDADPALKRINAHHITDRTLMSNGGYVEENGITVCEDPCHLKVEQYHLSGEAYPGLHPDDLYKKIESTYLEAQKASEQIE